MHERRRRTKTRRQKAEVRKQAKGRRERHHRHKYTTTRKDTEERVWRSVGKEVGRHMIFMEVLLRCMHMDIVMIYKSTAMSKILIEALCASPQPDPELYSDKENRLQEKTA